MSKKDLKKPLDAVEVTVNRKKKQKKMMVIGGVVLALCLCIGGFFFYRNSQDSKAEKAMTTAVQLFNSGEFDKALKGDGKNMGLEAIVKKYGSTEHGNLTKAYAGLAYAQQGKYQEAKKYLEDFDAQDDEMVSTMAQAALGNVYVSLGEKEKGAQTLEEAAKKANNAVVSPIAFVQAGEVYEALGKKDKALEMYQEVKKNFANTPQGVEIDKYIERINASK